MRIFRYGLFIIFFIVIAAVGLLIAVPLLVDTQTVRDQVTTRSEKLLGRKLVIDGELKIVTFPNVEVRLGDVSLENPTGFAEKNFATMKGLDVKLKLLPLIAGRMELEEFILNEPQIALVRRASGEVNWTFGTTENQTDRPPSDQENKQVEVPNLVLGKVAIKNGQLTYSDHIEKQSFDVTNINLNLDMPTTASDLNVDGSFLFKDRELSAKLFVEKPSKLSQGSTNKVRTTIGYGFLDGTLNGTLTLSPKIEFAGQLDANISSIASLIQFMDIKNPYADKLEQLRLNTQINVKNGHFSFHNLNLKHKGQLLNFDSVGKVNLGEEWTADLAINGESPNLNQLLFIDGSKPPYADLFGQARFGLNVKGNAKDLQLSNIKLEHNSDEISLKFDGSSRISGENMTWNGAIDTQISQLRQIALSLGIPLPPGENIFRSLSFVGNIHGTSSAIQIKDSQLKLDDIETKILSGNFALKNRPSLSASVTMNQVDLSPYVKHQIDPNSAESEAAGNKFAWSETPLELEWLHDFDARIIADINGLTIDPYYLEKSKALTTVENGQLQFLVEETSLYGGRGIVDFSLDARNAPRMALKTEMVKIKAQPFLKQAANFSRLIGDANLNIDVVGQGESPSDIMNSLRGKGQYSFTDGLIEGVDLNMLKKVGNHVKNYKELGIADLINLPQNLNIGGNTQIDKIRGGFKMVDGVAKTDGFIISTPYGTMTGSGFIDVGGQKLDFMLTPKIDTAKIPQLANYNLGLVDIPVHWSGGFGGIGAPRVDLIAALKGPIQDAAKKKATEKLLDNVVKDDKIKNVLDNVLGGSGTQNEKNANDNRSTSDKLEDAARDAIFDAITKQTNKKRDDGRGEDQENSQKEEDKAEEQKEEKSTEEELLEGLGKLFGN